MADGQLRTSTLGDLVSALGVSNSGNDSSSTQPMSATVMSFDDEGVCWCELNNSDRDVIPVEELTIAAKVGDTINVRIRDGIAYGEPSSETKVAVDGDLVTNVEVKSADYVAGYGIKIDGNEISLAIPPAAGVKF